jgi:tripartite-type tricarboxylate transporter receptor subunit TctC
MSSERFGHSANMATAGVGTTLHIFGELFKMMAGVELVPEVYHGGAPALLDLIAGRSGWRLPKGAQ